MSDINHKTILIDCDVISHFVANNALADLPKILAPHTCVVLDFVYDEVAVNQFRLAFLDSLIKKSEVVKLDFPHDNEDIKEEFARIKKVNYLIGDGERACMAVARYRKNVVASSNFRDVAPYCNENNIFYLGTLDILSIAVTKDLYDENKCDAFIQTALQYNRANFPKGVTAMKFYTPKDLSFL